MITKHQFQHLVEELENRNMIPAHMDIAQVGKIHMVNLYNRFDSPIISSTVTTGMDTSLEVATLKALSEFIERFAFQEGYKNSNPYCMTDRSDGFAAFPKLDSNFKEETRENALNEAIERYAWATWWDNTDTRYTITEVSLENKDFWGDSIDLILEVDDMLGIDSLKVISPNLNKFEDRQLLIIACELASGGVITGGACGKIENNPKTILRAVSELARHALALYRAEVENYTPTSFYEKRLFFFASEEGFKIYKNRVDYNGDKSIDFTVLKIDSEIKHEFMDLFYVHRCLFENQPAFIGGNIERLCL